MKISPEGDVLAFVEKPGKNDALFEGLEAPPELLKRFNISSPSEPLYLANMGIYSFNLGMLEEALSTDACDFGKEILPSLLGKVKVRAHLFQGYWEDIGTIGAFHRANIELASPSPQFDFFDPEAPIYSHARLLPATRVQRASVTASLVSDGCVIDHAEIDSSLIGMRAIIGKGCTIRRCYVMGADFYEADADSRLHRLQGEPPLGIGEGTHIENAIIDKNARVGRNVTIRNREEHTTFDDGKVVIREGITVVPRGAVIPDGYSI